GDIMSDGIPTPGAHDGMAAFAGPGSHVRLVRNHERNTGAPFATPAYDPLAAGGTTNLVYDTARRELVRDNASLSGTVRNCAGGPTPWNSWLTCEENTSDRGQPHGYIFDVPATAQRAVEPVPLKAMGRLVHEACAVDPATGIVYETEDRGESGFYRFVPSKPGDLAAGGRLQMLAVKARPGYDTRTGQRVGKPLPVMWVDIADPDPANAGADPGAVFKQGAAAGGATFDRLEGCWHGDGSIFFVSTSGGDAGLGQVFEYRPRGSSGGQLILVFESEDPDVLQSPDNLTVSPRGGLLLCEDGASTDYLRGVNPEGQIFDFGRNDLNGSEFAGATYSPDGQTLFVNIQSPGISFAITGPFEKGAL
ncbi:MAG: PhoX family protein, partial [Actinomycetota bacterium]|nr:PhoX family protein [Actinomycetota bacterium]